MGLQIEVAQRLSPARLGQLTNKDNPSGTLETALGGTVTLAAGSTSVVGAGTAFTTALVVGAVITFSSQPGTGYVVSSITSATALTLSQAYTGAGVAGATAAVAGVNLNVLVDAVYDAQMYFQSQTGVVYDDTTATNPAANPPTANTCHFVGVPLVVAHLYEFRAQPWPEAQIEKAWEVANNRLKAWVRNFGTGAFAPFQSNSQLTPSQQRGVPDFDNLRVAPFVPRDPGSGQQSSSGVPNDWTGP